VHACGSARHHRQRRVRQSLMLGDSPPISK
jgi:hypothetical protein